MLLLPSFRIVFAVGCTAVLTLMATAHAASVHDGRAMNRLMVVGGYADSVDQVEVVDLSGDSLACPQFEIQSGPIGMDAVGAFLGDRVVVCAEYSLAGEDKCHGYDNQTNTWAVLPGTLVHPYSSRGGVVLSNGGWWLTGGVGFDPPAGDDFHKAETEIVRLIHHPATDGSNNDADGTLSVASEPFVDLPRPTSQHVTLLLNESTVVFLGGGDKHYDDFWLFDLSTMNDTDAASGNFINDDTSISSAANKWTPMPTMPKARISPAAGLATFPDGSRQLVVAGGLDDTSTDIFDFGTNTWRPARADANTSASRSEDAAGLPNDVFDARSVQFKDTFLIVGGLVSEVNWPYYRALRTIFQFDPATEGWIERPETLSQEKHSFAAFVLPDDYVECI